MSWLPITALFFVAWLAIFGQTQFRPVANFFATPVALLPALLVYAALTHGLGTVAVFAVVCSLFVDALSATPLGISVLPMFAVGFGLHLRQHLILRDQHYAQFWLGLGAGIVVPLLVLMLLRLGASRPIHGPFLVWQLAVTGLFNGILCPAIFRFFDTLRRTFDYQPIVEGSFRSDREIKRGRL